MEIREYENLIISKLKDVVDSIIINNPELNISAKARAGAEISDWLEEKFVELTQNHDYFENSESAPKGSTKNPWDARTVFKWNDIREEIWIDFKAFKITSADSNPDIGTPNKIFKLIREGNFYHAFIHVFYQSKGNGLEFVNYNDSYSKLYFIKDISSTFRRNPKNQLQVNISSPTEYRTREDFIKLLIKKIKESHIRQIEISNRALKEIDQTESKLIEANKKSEEKLIKKIQ
ncbi:MAG: hypothetical protein LBS88_13480 [Tannerellaceae bacterium]|jgi:hypothetical protein|nr:hypothetical protein [Tannerellaceae bacterium]